MSRIFSTGLWIVTIIFFGLSALVDASGQAKTAGGAGPPPAGHQSSKPAKPGPASPPPAKADLRPVPRAQTSALEERLQRGQMEEAVPQGQVSDRLEQFHKASSGTP